MSTHFIKIFAIFTFLKYSIHGINLNSQAGLSLATQDDPSKKTIDFTDKLPADISSIYIQSDFPGSVIVNVGKTPTSKPTLVWHTNSNFESDPNDVTCVFRKDVTASPQRDYSVMISQTGLGDKYPKGKSITNQLVFTIEPNSLNTIVSGGLITWINSDVVDGSGSVSISGGNMYVSNFTKQTDMDLSVSHEQQGNIVFESLGNSIKKFSGTQTTSEGNLCVNIESELKQLSLEQQNRGNISLNTSSAAKGINGKITQTPSGNGTICSVPVKFDTMSLEQRGNGTLFTSANKVEGTQESGTIYLMDNTENTIPAGKGTVITTNVTCPEIQCNFKDANQIDATYISTGSITSKCLQFFGDPTILYWSPPQGSGPCTGPNGVSLMTSNLFLVALLYFLII